MNITVIINIHHVDWLCSMQIELSALMPARLSMMVQPEYHQ